MWGGGGGTLVFYGNRGAFLLIYWDWWINIVCSFCSFIKLFTGGGGGIFLFLPDGGTFFYVPSKDVWLYNCSYCWPP